MLFRQKKIKGIPNESGQALVETALVVPFLMVILVIEAVMVQAFYSAIEVANAAKAGVAYGSQNITTASDATGIGTAASMDAGNLSSTLTTTATLTGICSSGTACTGSNSTCTNTDCSTPGDHIENILTVKTSATVTPFIHIPSQPATYTVRGSAVQKVIH